MITPRLFFSIVLMILAVSNFVAAFVYPKLGSERPRTIVLAFIALFAASLRFFMDVGVVAEDPAARHVAQILFLVFMVGFAYQGLSIRRRQKRSQEE